MDPDIRRSWDDFLNPEVLRPRLISASLYIAGFEALKGAIVDRIRDFYSVGFDKAGPKVGPRYQAKVLCRNRSPVYASLDWLKESGAVDDDDIETFDRVKVCRNTLAHELFAALESQGLPSDFEDRLGDMVALLHKIEVWWIINVEIPTNPDHDGREVDESMIIPGPVMFMHLLSDIALGDDEKSRAYLDLFRESTGK